MNSLRQYNDLSLRERAAIIHTAVKNGYRSLPDIVDAYNKFADGGITLPTVVVTPRASYVQYTGEETNVPTLQDYYNARAEETAVNAAYNILNQKAPLVPLIPSQSTISRAAGLFGMPDSERINRYGVLTDPQTCIYTATGMYCNPDNQVSGNKTFAENPQKYGFIEVPNNSSQVGDLMQFNRNRLFGLLNTPHHSTIITGYNDKGQPALSYSNGDSTEWTTDDKGNKVHSMKYDNDNWNAEWNQGPRDTWDWSSLYSIGTPHRFRFIGSNSDRIKWNKEHKEKYKK